MNLSVNRLSKLPHNSADHPPEPPEQAANSTSGTTGGDTPEATPRAIAAMSASDSGVPAKEEQLVADSEIATPAEQARVHPIPPPSEPMQYRAIGLVRGQYMPSAEQFTRGTLLADDETLIDAVLLGRVMSLVKNHLSLDQPHLWVVYPRTRQEDGNLHVQIVGVWEPERLQQSPPSQTEDSSDPKETQSEDPVVTNGYFSVRGEVIFQSREEEGLIVKIKQAPRKLGDKPKFFKLKLTGILREKGVGHFWEFQVQRQQNNLLIQEAKDIGLLPVKKRKPPFGGSRPSAGAGGKRPFTSPRSKGDKPTPITPPKRREPLPKPVKRQGPPPESKK